MKYKILSLVLTLSCITATFASADDDTSSSASSRTIGKLYEDMEITDTKVMGIDTAYEKYNRPTLYVLGTNLSGESTLSIIDLSSKGMVTFPMLSDRNSASSDIVPYYVCKEYQSFRSKYNIAKKAFEAEESGVYKYSLLDTKNATEKACIGFAKLDEDEILVDDYVYVLSNTSGSISVANTKTHTKIGDIQVGVPNTRFIAYIKGTLAVACEDRIRLFNLDQLKSQLHIATTAVAPSSASSASTTPPAAK